MDKGLARGTVCEEPQFVKNGNEIRCVFMLAVESPNPKGAGTSIATMRVVTEPELAPRCEALLEKGSRVIVFGDIGAKGGRLKMRAVSMDLPDVTVTPTA